jgi:hypothetical protein
MKKLIDTYRNDDGTTSYVYMDGTDIYTIIRRYGVTTKAIIEVVQFAAVVGFVVGCVMLWLN